MAFSFGDFHTYIDVDGLEGLPILRAGGGGLHFALRERTELQATSHDRRREIFELAE